MIQPFQQRAIARWSAKAETYLSSNAFTVLFIFFYFAVLLLMFFWGAVGEYTRVVNGKGHHHVMRWFIAVARGFGYTLNLNTAFVILIASRLFFTWIRETPLNLILPLDKAFPGIHILVGYVIAISVVFHGAFHMVWIVGWNQWKWGLWQVTMSVITGFILCIVFGLMLLFARPKVRQEKFHLFYIVHIVGATLFFILLVFHGMYNGRPETYKYITPPLIIYMIDRICRRLKISNQTLKLSAENSIFKDNSILELRAPKPFEYRTGQYAEIMVPSISSSEWHPFTIASANHEKTIRFYVKGLGDWTNALHKAFQARLDGTIQMPLDVKIRGPYGAPAQHVDGYDRVVLISGGIGATPFSAICKELHHLQTKENKQVVSEFQNRLIEEKIEKRVRHAISSLYSVDIENLENTDEEEEQKSRFVTNMLNLTSVSINAKEHNHRQQQQQHQQQPSQSNDLETGYTTIDVDDEEEFTSSDEGDSSESIGSFYTADGQRQTEGKSGMPRGKSRGKRSFKGQKSNNDMKLEFGNHSSAWEKMAKNRFNMLHSIRSRLLSFLHTTRFMFVLLITLIVRIVIISMGSIFKSDFIRIHTQPDESFGGFWVIIPDTILSIILAIALPLTICLELSFMGSRYFSTFGRSLDLFTFVPMTILSAGLSIRTCILKQPDNGAIVFIHYVVLIPLMFILLLLRMYRSIGSRCLLSEPRCKCETHRSIPDVDFVWTSPKDGDDKWLLNELQPLTKGTHVRLHRYLTRETEENIQNHISNNGFTTLKAGRPQWDELFQRIIEHAPSRSVIGIFFCGPHKMGESIKKSMKKIEVISNLRGAYLNSASDMVLAEDLMLKGTHAVEKLKTHGCSVRFVFREENFG